MAISGRRIRKKYTLLAWPRKKGRGWLGSKIDVRAFSKSEALSLVRRFYSKKRWQLSAITFLDYSPVPEQRSQEVLDFVAAYRRAREESNNMFRTELKETLSGK